MNYIILFTQTGRAPDHRDFLPVDGHWQLVSKVKRENARTEKKLARSPPVLPLTTFPGRMFKSSLHGP